MFHVEVTAGAKGEWLFEDLWARTESAKVVMHDKGGKPQAR